MEENLEKSKTSPEKNPDLIVEIKATPEQMDRFGIKINGSKIIFKGREGGVHGDTGTLPLADTVFDFSRISPEVGEHLNQDPQEFEFGDTKLTMFPIKRHFSEELSFPDATYVSLTFCTPKTKPRNNVPGEYRAGDYFELLIKDKKGKKKVIYLEEDWMINYPS